MVEDPIVPFEGWTLPQALERTADPRVWDDWLSANEELKRVSAIIPSSPGAFITPSPEKVRTARRAVEEVDKKRRIALRQLLIEGSLIATGSRSLQSNPPTVISRDGWRTLVLWKLERSIIVDRSTPPIPIFNVRVFPLIHSEDAATRLSGLSLAAIFRKCVLDDPEVVACSKRIADRQRYEDVFTKGQTPGPYVEFAGSCDMTASELAFDFVRPVVFFTGQELPRAPAAIQRVSEIIVNRWQRLRIRLVDGELVARGTHERTGMVRYIEPLQWARKELSIDVVNSDLLEMKNNKPVVQWSGLTLVRPKLDPFARRANLDDSGEFGSDASMFHVRPRVDDPLPPTTTLYQSMGATTRKARRARAEAECLIWLKAIVQASPDVRTHTYQRLWLEARQRWGNDLSERAFQRVRAQCVADLPAWRDGGASRKTSALEPPQ